MYIYIYIYLYIRALHEDVDGLLEGGERLLRLGGLRVVLGVLLRADVRGVRLLLEVMMASIIIIICMNKYYHVYTYIYIYIERERERDI